MKIKIIKGLLSIYGAMVPGKEITVRQHIGMNWIKNGIAVAIDDTGNEIALEPEPEVKPKGKPKVIPVGMFWCSRCHVLHRVASKIGKRHLQYSS